MWSRGGINIKCPLYIISLEKLGGRKKRSCEVDSTRYSLGIYHFSFHSFYFTFQAHGNRVKKQCLLISIKRPTLWARWFSPIYTILCIKAIHTLSRTLHVIKVSTIRECFIFFTKIQKTRKDVFYFYINIFLEMPEIVWAQCFKSIILHILYT